MTIMHPLTLSSLALLTTVLVHAGKHNQWQQDDTLDKGWVRPGRSKGTRRRSVKPNIVFIIADDQDLELGSMNFMPQTLKILQEGGATFTNAFVTTPMCCPSRSSMLTGMYVHNHNTYTNNDNCSSIQWQETHEKRNFGTYLTNAGYRTGYFGKYLNEYTGDHIPPGWTEWVGLIKNTRFYNYSLNFNGIKVKHSDDYYKDYLTNLIANDSVTFLKQSKQYFPNRPVAMVLSMPAPHGPEDAAPQHQNLFMNITTHRTPSYNFAPNPDKQWLLQNTGKMGPIQIAFTDLLHTKRLQTLQSVDDAVQKIYDELKGLGELDNTYIVYSSDHGYHLGQYGMVKGKSTPYDFDVRVPLYMRGPKVPRGIKVPSIALNIDLAPTFLDMAQVPIPEHMDGRSFLKLFDGTDVPKDGVLKKKKAWRDSFLISRGKITTKKILNRERLEAQKNMLQVATTKEQRLVEECQKPEYQPPCAPGQIWECKNDDATGKLRMYKCRFKDAPLDSTLQHLDPADAPFVQRHGVPEGMCECPWQQGDTPVIDRLEKARQRSFLRHNVNQPEMLRPKFLKKKDKQGARIRRYLDDGPMAPKARRRQHRAERNQTRSPHATHQRPQDLPVSCRVLPNNTVSCDDVVYADVDAWKSQRHSVNDMIQQYKERLEALKDVRRHLKNERPTSPSPFEAWREPTFDFSNPQNRDPFDGRAHDTQDNMDPLDSTEDGDTPSSLDYVDEDTQLANYLGQVHVDKTGQEWCPCHIQPPETRGKGRAHSPGDKTLIVDRGTKRKTNKQMRREKKRMERDRLRAEKRAERQRQKMGILPTEIQPIQINPGRDCNSAKCITQKYEYGRTPLWHQDDIQIQGKHGRRFKQPGCTHDGLECSMMDNEHWRTPPLWTLGDFCFCTNSNNNTYWCLRTINDTHNFLYCEFITGFISYYDMVQDPYQLRNAVHDLSYSTLQQLSRSLDRLKGCHGKQCTMRARPTPVDDVTNEGPDGLINDTLLPHTT